MTVHLDDVEADDDDGAHVFGRELAQGHQHLFCGHIYVWKCICMGMFLWMYGFKGADRAITTYLEVDDVEEILWRAGDGLPLRVGRLHAGRDECRGMDG